MEFTVADLPPAERALAGHLERGTVYGPASGNTSPCLVIRAGTIRNLLRGVLHNLTPDPKGLRLRHVRIEGRLDLDHLDTKIPLELDRCELSEGLTALHAHLSVLRLLRLTIDRPAAEPVLHLDNLHLSELDLSGTTLINVQGPALSANRITVESDAVLNGGFVATGYGPDGAIRLPGARIGGWLRLTGAKLTNETGPALIANKLTVEASAHLDAKFTAIGSDSEGVLRLSGACIGGWLRLSGAILKNETGAALLANGLTVGASAHFDDGFTATGHGNPGAVQLMGAHIGGRLRLSGATLANRSGPALIANSLTVESDVALDKAFTADGNGPVGTVWLSGARIGGALSMSGANITNRTGPAILANGLTVDSSAHFNEGFKATGRGDHGTIHLRRANFGGRLRLSGAKLSNETGPALLANGLTVEADVFLDKEFTVTGHGDRGAVALVGANIKGSLILDNAHFPEANHKSDEPTVVLRGTAVGASLDISSKILEKESTSGRWDINDFTYRTLKADPNKWLIFLREATLSYSPQPYQQFAAVARAQGDERLTQKILIAQHHDPLTHGRIQHGLLTRKQRAGLHVLRATVGYGYKTWKALGWLAGVVTLAVIFAVAFGFGKTTFLQQPDDPETACSTASLVILGLDTIPLISLISEATDQCTITDTIPGLAFLAVIIMLKIIAWALVTLFVAGYTNIVRKPGP